MSLVVGSRDPPNGHLDAGHPGPQKRVSVFPDDVRLKLELLDERRFGNGMVHLRYRT